MTSCERSSEGIRRFQRRGSFSTPTARTREGLARLTRVGEPFSQAFVPKREARGAIEPLKLLVGEGHDQGDRRLLAGRDRRLAVLEADPRLLEVEVGQKAAGLLIGGVGLLEVVGGSLMAVRSKTLAFHLRWRRMAGEWVQALVSPTPTGR